MEEQPTRRGVGPSVIIRIMIAGIAFYTLFRLLYPFLKGAWEQ